MSWKGRAVISWPLLLPPFAIAPMEKSESAAIVGLGTEVLHPATVQMKYCNDHLALCEALPCSNGVSRTFGKV